MMQYRDKLYPAIPSFPEGRYTHLFLQGMAQRNDPLRVANSLKVGSSLRLQNRLQYQLKLLTMCIS